MSGGSPSLRQPGYWWYEARAQQFSTVFGPYIGRGDLLLDVGSADGPSVAWVDAAVRRVSLDLDPRGLSPGMAVSGDIMRLPFRDGTFDAVGAFDVLEHCEPEAEALAEAARVLRPGGRLLVAVPAYAWAWSSHDVHNGHHRRYTRTHLVRILMEAGLEVDRASYAFAGVFPLFAAHRLVARARDQLSRRPDAQVQDVVTVPRLPAVGERVLLGLSAIDRRLLARTDLPFGSSVLAAAVKRH